MYYMALAHVFVVRHAHQPGKNCDSAYFSVQWFKILFSDANIFH